MDCGSIDGLFAAMRSAIVVATVLTGLPADDSRHSRGRSVRLALAAIACVLVALPFFAVTFPPIADLPQHAAQIRLLVDALSNPDSVYRIQWLTPYSLSYTVVGAVWALFSPEQVGRIAFMIVGFIWVLGIHVLAWKRGRAPEAAVLASMLFFSHALYWGFLSFLFGWPVFVLWLCLIAERRPKRFQWFDVPLFLGGGVLLYFSHALWLAAGATWFVLSSLALRAPLVPSLLRLASVAPMLVVAALWYPRLAAAGFASSTIWAEWPMRRLSITWMVDAIFGGVRGPLESVMVGLLVAWILVSLWQSRHRLAQASDRELLLAAGLFALAVLVLPDKQSNTIYFASRWAAPTMVLLLLAVPTPALSAAFRRVVPLVIVAAFCLTTTVAWLRFERIEMSGLGQVLSALPERPRIIGLDLVRTSEVIKGRPFLQTFAYGQVLRGGELNFSFADFAPSLVVYKTHRKPPWTMGLEWFAHTVKWEDFQYFDFAILNALEAQHEQAKAIPRLSPVTTDGRWRLYRVAKGPG